MSASFVARASAYALSAGAHVAIMVVTFGHAAPGNGAAAVAPTEIVEIPVDVAPIPEPPPAPLNNVAAAGSPMPPTHTHPYPVPFDHDAHPHDPNLVHAPIAGHDDDHDHDHDAQPVAEAPAAATPSFTMVVTTGGARTPGGLASGSGTGPSGHATTAPAGAGSGGDGPPLAEAAVSTPARLVGSVTPAYPSGAREQEIEAAVALEIIVAKDGQVIDARVTRPAGYGFDEAALHAIRAARFTPARKDGVAVPVRMHWSVAFRLR